MSTTTTSTTPRGNARQRARAERVRQIRDGARVRQELSQGTLYEFAGGEHIVIFRGERYRGPTIDAAIQAAQTGPAE